jgi:hypothetical protein
MRPILEVILSLLAVVGLLSLSWLLLGHILTPAGNGETVSLVPGQGDGEDLEQAVRGLLWLRGGGLLTGSVVIVDCGLSPEGRAIAAALCVREPGVEVWPLSQLSVYIKRKEP